MISNREIFLSAVALACESVGSGDLKDYEERAPYLLASVCTQCASLDRIYRKENNLSPALPFKACLQNLSDTFPLSDVFAPAASYYLASMLVLDENESMSDKLFAKYTDAVLSLQKAVPARCESIKERY